MWSPKVKTIDALERGLVTLKTLQEMQAASLHELHLRTGIPKATLLRILLTLERQGLIWQRLADGLFRPSYTLHERARRIDRVDHLIECAAPELEQLQSSILWPSDLAVRRGTTMALCESNRTHSYFVVNRDKLGYEINMLRSAIGRAYLAYCPGDEREEILAALRANPRAGDELAGNRRYVAQMLRDTRRAGYGVRDRHFGGSYDKSRAAYNDGLSAIAVPIMLPDGTVAGCINIVWIERLFKTEEMAAKHLKRLVDASRKIAVKIAGS
ncbi:helix-turn-helix domain-containing protein [Paraburkholderia sp. MMS20-SJTR3]|uniref:Helix-turn-helix domain-containing protein n=1 Tax=Paraburkholderia sejongensis TaxID=2886946 RepID=A0ABS8K0W2_9BURK|nr:IclR family transcriptional regulator C-terminal domain-containing protein [Paraburkholderia sp. MMS20-SJTR3]MCC8395795.1 helix-turn-helix domain-containing protein [Paraburkholderia sp. MMS20-SJTR3]